MSVNKVILLGRLGQDPEIKYTGTQMAVCNFSLATTEMWNDKRSGQKNEKTEWHRVVVWGKLAELCGQYLAKGRQVYLEGRLQTRSWEDKEGGKKYTTEVVASVVQFISPKETGAGASMDRGEMSGGNPYANNNSGPAHSNPVNQDYQISTDSNFTADDIPF